MNAENRWTVDESILLLAKVGRCWSPSFSPDGRELAFVSDLSGSPQVWRIALSGGFPEAVTAFDEQVNTVLWSPSGDWLAVESALGGGMNAQIDLVRPDGGDRRRLTEGGSTNNWLNLWAKDSRYVLFSSNMDQSDSMDSFRVCVESGASENLTKNSGIGVIEDVTADGGSVLVKRVAYRGDNNVHLVDALENHERCLTPHDPPASFEYPRFSADERHVYLISNRDRDFACLCWLSLDEDEQWRVLQARDDAELVEFALSPSAQSAAIIWNVAGRHELELIDLPRGDKQSKIALPGEIVEDLCYAPDGSRLAMCVTGSRLPQEIWVLDMATLSLRQLTRSPRVGLQTERLAPAQLMRYSAHDGLPLTGWFYAPPDTDAPFPTVFSFHGGPEGQEQPRFRYDYQALLSAGIAVFAPNVRGSSGFGKRFVNLDNGALRFDAIQDIASSVHFLLGAGIAQAGKLGIMGGSYGGYMTMAGLTDFPELFAAGVNLYGVVNFKTFFERTEPWMASVSKVEYGDPDTEGALLDALSPIYKLDRVAAATLVMHGANDTNVPVYEAEQVVSELRMRNVPVEYILFPDEGHGFRKEQNRIRCASAIVQWFTERLLSL